MDIQKKRELDFIDDYRYYLECYNNTALNELTKECRDAIRTQLNYWSKEVIKIVLTYID